MCILATGSSRVTPVGRSGPVSSGTGPSCCFVGGGRKN